MYPQVHRVLGFICKMGLMNRQRLAFSLPQIQAMSEKNIWVEGEPTEADPNQLNQLETLLYHEVWSESGAPLGKVKDCLFELKTGKITQYLVALKGWRSVFNELYPLPPTEVLSFGKKRILVSDRAGEDIQKQRDRIQQTLVELRQDYQSWKQEVLHFSQRAQTLTQETVDKTVQSLKDLGAQLSDLGENGVNFREDPRSSAPDSSPPDLDSEDLFDFSESPQTSTTQGDIPDRPSSAPEVKDPSSNLFEWVEQVKAESEQWTDEDFGDDEFEEDEFEADEFGDDEFGDDELKDPEFNPRKVTHNDHSVPSAESPDSQRSRWEVWDDWE
jgi:sporulation protein YlmC with PRC-barrel domain